MKRTSKAEEALKKQIKLIEAHMESLASDIKYSQAKMSAAVFIREQLEREVNRLYNARIAASERQATKLRAV